MVIARYTGQHICYPFSRHFKSHSCYQYLDVSKNGWTYRKLRCICVVTQGTNRYRQLLELVCPQASLPPLEVGEGRLADDDGDGEGHKAVDSSRVGDICATRTPWSH